MLDSQSAAFAERVWDVASQLGNNAPKIADDIMEAAFPLTPAQVVLCLLDLKLARLAHDPSHEDSAVDVCGYAALLRELTETSNTEGH